MIKNSSSFVLENTMYPKTALVSVTNRCNARCVMCHIWEQPSSPEMPPDFYSRLPSTLTHINLTGGEPYLRTDLASLSEVVQRRCPRARIVISTNGLIPKMVQSETAKMKVKIRRLAIRVSLDGMNDVHDKVRGMKGAFDRVLESINGLKNLGIRDLGFAFTILDSNLPELKKVYSFSRESGIELALSLAQSSEFYFCTENRLSFDKSILIENLGSLIIEELKAWHPKHWFRAYFALGLLKYALGKRQSNPCSAGREFFYLDCEGNLYPCHVVNIKLGNLAEQTFEEIWFSQKSEEVRKKLKNCNKCWMICTSASFIRHHPLGPALWILINKIKTGLGLFNIEREV